MKQKQVYFSITFLFIFFSSFSVNTFISIHSSVKSFCHFSKHSELQQTVPPTATEDLVFEESENDGKESLDPLKTLLPSFLNFHLHQLIKIENTISFSSIENEPHSIFLSIRVLRI